MKKGVLLLLSFLFVILAVLPFINTLPARISTSGPAPNLPFADPITHIFVKEMEVDSDTNTLSARISTSGPAPNSIQFRVFVDKPVTETPTYIINQPNSSFSELGYVFSIRQCLAPAGGVLVTGTHYVNVQYSDPDEKIVPQFVLIEGSPKQFTTTSSSEICDSRDNDGDCEVDEGGVCAAVNCTDKTNGTLCDDGLWCTLNDACSGGVCTGAARVCPEDSYTCTTAFCDDASNICAFSFEDCECDIASDCPDDNNPCTFYTCEDLLCKRNYRSATCTDSDECTRNDRCSMGRCTGDEISGCREEEDEDEEEENRTATTAVGTAKNALQKVIPTLVEIGEVFKGWLPGQTSEAAGEDKEQSIWLWLAPTLILIIIIAGVVAFVISVRKSKQASQQVSVSPAPKFSDRAVLPKPTAQNLKSMPQKSSATFKGLPAKKK